MNTFGVWYDPTTWFQDEAPDVTGTGGSFTTNPNTDPFGWSSWFSGGSTDIQAGVSDSQLSDWNTYWSSGGVMGADLSNPVSITGGSSGSSFDFLGGVNDFLAGITGVAQTGLGIWQGVQTIINQQNPTDELVRLPGSNTPVVKRVTGGQTQYYPITQLYPSLTPQVQQAQNSWIGPALIAGVLGIGLIFILKKD